MRFRLVQCLALLVLLLGSRGALAQRILRGTVRDSSFAAPLPGAVVTIVDSSGGTTARTISDAEGRFSIAVSPRASTIRLIRIGYHPRDLPVAGAAPSLELVMSRIPPILDAVRVSDRELCPGSADRGPAFQFWEQARAGLLAEVVAREANPASATTLVYQRRQRIGDDLVRQQTAQTRSGQTTRPFVAAAPAATFASRGYMVVESNEDRVYSAPDADVLLDPSFATTHCFHLQTPDAAHTGQIGLAFTPVPGRPDSLVDVAGVIWLDRSAPVLRSLDFHYTNLEPAAARVPSGGHLEFRSVANGVSFIERWSLRIAILVPGPTTRRTSTEFQARETRANRVDMVVQEVQETGGQVIAATWKDGLVWRDSVTGIRGLITQRGDDKPVSHAIVRLLGTSNETFTDPRGQFELQPIVPGKYMVEVVDTTLIAFADPRKQSRAIDVARGQIADFRASVTPGSDAIMRLCKDSPPERLTTVVAGRVLFPSMVSPSRAQVDATWQADYTGYVGVAVTIETAHRSTNLDDDGRFTLCRVSANRPLKLRVVVGGTFADTTVVPPEGQFTVIDWRPKLAPVTPPKP